MSTPSSWLKSRRTSTAESRRSQTFGRYLRQTKTGKPKLAKGKISKESKLGGKYLVSTSDEHLSTEDVTLGYKQLHEDGGIG